LRAACPAVSAAGAEPDVPAEDAPAPSATPASRNARRVAAIDCGTNSIRLLIADVVAGQVSDRVREMRIVRLGENVDATGRLSDAALSRTFEALDVYAGLIHAHEVPPDAIRMAATSATRDAENREAFVAGVVDRLGVSPDVLTGDEEAALSFAGAGSALLPGTPEPWLVVDIGGGSTECVLGDASGVRAARSVNVGCVRITERRLRADPPSADEIAAAVDDIDGALRLAAETVDLAAAATLVGLAGSVTTVTALALDLPAYEPTAIHGSRITATDVHQVATDLLRMTRQERAALPVMHPGRADVIAAGALILDRVLVAAGADSVVASEHDILDGLALSVAQR
jgi:exopolyphosphatase/guanosine-5'-triphosphate,3'-diphosphate pyrophosphatase